MERSCVQFDRRDRDALDDDYRDHDAEGRFQERLDTAQRLTRSLGSAWHGWEFWHVVTEMNMSPATTAASWSFEEVYEAYYYLRLKYLRGGG